jgi:superfamily II DNA or RNA helicase
VEQTLEDYVNVGLDVGVYYGNRKDLDKTHTICTWQSLAILDKKSEDIRAIEALSNLLSNVNTVIVDEVHSVKGELLRKFLTKNIARAPIRWGLTGTVPKEKFESEGIFTSLGPLTGGVTAHELQESGVLSNCSVNILQLYDLAEFKTYPEETKYLTTSIPRMQYISDLINEISESGNTLVLVSRIETGKMLAENIPGSVFLSGKITTKNRKEEFDEVKTVDNKVIIATAGIAAVGINIVRLFNLVLIEPGKSFVRVIQSIGRGLRKGGDKDHVNIYDITSTCRFSKRHLTTRKKYYRDAQYNFTVKKVDWNA